MYIITAEYNDYNQYGEYFVGIIPELTLDNIRKIFPDRDEEFLNHILNGGGRVDYQFCWYNLFKVEECKNYHEDSD